MVPVSPVEMTACRVCGGDPRASLDCQACHGAGVSVMTPEGSVVWSAPLDGAAFVWRKRRAKWNALFHLAVALVILLCFGAFVFGILSSPVAGVWMTPDFWLGGHWYVTLLWLAGFLICFFIFRVRVYTDQAKPLPTWGMTPSAAQLAKPVTETKDISVYFAPEAWVALEQANQLAEQLQRTEVQPVHVFAAILGSSVGGILMTRLGLQFDQIKDGLAMVLRRGSSGTPTLFSKQVRELLLQAYLDARNLRRRSVGLIELFLLAFNADRELQQVFDAAGFPAKHVAQVAEWIRMQERLKEEHDRFVSLAAMKPNTAMNRSMTARRTVFLDRFAEDLTLAARNGYIGPSVGREQEMEELLRGIESGRRSVVLVGESGSGKMSLVESLARRMVEEDVPPELFDRRLMLLQLPQLLAGGDPAQASERLLYLLQEVAMSGNVILVIPGIEALVGEGGAALDLAETFAAELDKGYFIAIGTTTPRAWTTYLERRTLGSKLVRVNVPDLDVDHTIQVLMLQSGYIEFQNKVFFSYGALEKTATLAARYLTDGHLPESAIAIAREAAVLARKTRGERGFVLPEDVASIVHDKTNIPVEAVTQDESQKLLDLEAHLHGRVIGQEDAVTAVASAMRRARAGVREGRRPIANFLFMGPTGVGKTELAKALGAEYFGSEQAMVRLDMSEYQDRSSVNRIIGAPGDERGGGLTEAVRKNPFTIVLLDELEKAHPDILTLFLQVMDDGRLTDGVGRTVDFTNTVVIATSNAGTAFIQEQVQQGVSIEQIKTALLERELKGIFRPEFLNRFDGVIVFKPLTLDDVTQIAWLLIGGVSKRLEAQGIGFRADDAAVEELAKVGFDPVFGARPLRRAIQERVDNGLADLLLRKTLVRGDTVVLEAGGQLRVEKGKFA